MNDHLLVLLAVFSLSVGVMLGKSGRLAWSSIIFYNILFGTLVTSGKVSSPAFWVMQCFFMVGLLIHNWQVIAQNNLIQFLYRLFKQKSSPHYQNEQPFNEEPNSSYQEPNWDEIKKERERRKQQSQKQSQSNYKRSWNQTKDDGAQSKQKRQKKSYQYKEKNEGKHGRQHSYDNQHRRDEYDRQSKPKQPPEKSLKDQYLELLGLKANQSYTAKEIKKAYRRKANQYHPDKHHQKPKSEQEKLTKLFQEIKQAYDGLMKFGVA